MDGILIIDKLAGITSHDVVERVRRILQMKRVGHTGTLDPFATGVMVILVGKATRLAQFIDKDEKEYEAVVQFGFETDTGDVTGVRTADSRMSNDEIGVRLETVNWEDILTKFRGEIMQTPPMYSAKKVEGRKLYELARQGIEIERKSVKVNIRELVITGQFAGQTSIGITVACSAGTYIRTLAEDIGRAAGLGAHLTRLRRIRAGIFNIDEAVDLAKLASHDSPSSFLRPIQDAIEHAAVFELRDDRVEKTRNGMSTRDLSGQFVDGQLVRMNDAAGELVAVGTYLDSEKVVQPKVVLG